VVHHTSQVPKTVTQSCHVPVCIHSPTTNGGQKLINALDIAGNVCRTPPPAPTSPFSCSLPPSAHQPTHPRDELLAAHAARHVTIQHLSPRHARAPGTAAVTPSSAHPNPRVRWNTAWVGVGDILGKRGELRHTECGVPVSTIRVTVCLRRQWPRHIVHGIRGVRKRGRWGKRPPRRPLPSSVH
jgi:hypothetical protein